METRLAERGWLTGITRAIPIVLGYIPIGFAFGVLAQKAGISLINTLLMSLLVYAGSSQLIAVGLIAAGAPALSVIITTFVVNLRHLLMSAAVSPFLKRWRKFELTAFAYQLTDETFAVHSARFASVAPNKAEPLALDYALPAMFVALLVLQIKDRIQIAVALLTGALAVGLVLIGMDQWNVIAATLVGATIGVGFEKWTKKSSS
jgi:predicted branched-subunit amino acid permease